MVHHGPWSVVQCFHQRERALVEAEVDTKAEMRLQGIGVQQGRVKVDTNTILVQTKQILLHWVIILDKGKS